MHSLNEGPAHFGPSSACRATPEALAAEGATVVAAGRGDERLAYLKERVEYDSGRLGTVQADVSDEGGRIDALLRQWVERARGTTSAV